MGDHWSGKTDNAPLERPIIVDTKRKYPIMIYIHWKAVTTIHHSALHNTSILVVL